jgi:hypothetical protein
MIYLRLDPFDSEKIDDAVLMARMRQERNALLQESDWTQTADNPISNKAAWATYRQQLRDFPASWTPAETLDLPDAPA